MRRDDGGGILGGARLALERAQVGAGEKAVDPELQERRRAFDRSRKRAAVVLPEVAGVTTGRQVGHLDLHLVCLLPLVPAFGGGLTGAVGVVCQHDLAGEVLQDLEVLVGESGAARRDGVGRAGEDERHDVGVALADHDLAARLFW